MCLKICDDVDFIFYCFSFFFQRDKESYLMTTLSSLIENHGFNSSFGIVIFIAETNLDYVKQTSQEIQSKFGDEIQKGIIEV